MYAGRPRGDGDRVARVRAEHVAGRRDELRQHDGGGGGRRGLEVLAGGRQRALERGGKREAGEAGLERLEPSPVIARRDGPRGEQRLGAAQHQPNGEQTVALGAPVRGGDERDQPLLARRRRTDHATSCSTARATSSGAMSRRQRWWPIGQRAVPVAEQGRQSRARSSTTAGAAYGKNPNCRTV